MKPTNTRKIRQRIVTLADIERRYGGSTHVGSLIDRLLDAGWSQCDVNGTTAFMFGGQE